MRGKIIFGLLILLSWWLVPLSAQESVSDAGSRAARYVLGSKDELLMNVNIWGFVKSPGQYLVPRNTDLITLMSFAGGPAEEAKIKSVEIIRSNATDSDQRILKVDVKKFLKTGDPHLIPELKPGDTILVSATRSYSIYKRLDVLWRLTAVAQLALIVYQVLN